MQQPVGNTLEAQGIPMVGLEVYSQSVGANAGQLVSREEQIVRVSRGQGISTRRQPFETVIPSYGFDAGSAVGNGYWTVARL